MAQQTKTKQKATFIREYGFLNSNISKIDIHQDPQGIWSGGIGATVWDAGIVLSKYLESNTSLIQNKSVLEIGSGTGLCGMICAKLGSKAVLFTDKDCAIPLLNKNLFENFYKYQVKLNKNVLINNQTIASADQKQNDVNNNQNNNKYPLLLSHELTWGNKQQIKSLCNFMKLHYSKYDSIFDIIILSDCICWKELHQLLVSSLESIVKFIATNNKNQKIPPILMSYEIRKDDEEQQFFDLLTKINWKYKKLSLNNIDPMYICDELVVYLITPVI